MITIILNAISAKKHAGGAFQISQNFLLKALEDGYIDETVNWYYIVSQDLDEAIGRHFLSLKETKYFVFPTQPDFRNSYLDVKKKLAELENNIKPDIIYSITAPSYFNFKTKEVMRFTNPWVTHPNIYSWKSYSFVERIKQMLYCSVQKQMMKSAYAFVTQTETTKKGIMRITGKSSDRVCVVSNVLPKIFQKLDTEPIADKEWINIACVGNPVPHKNFDILPGVILELIKMNITNIRFHTTIPYDSPMIDKIIEPLKKRNLEVHIVNHGRIPQTELGNMYQHCQFCFLPTLLEVFSASTIEAMYYKLPIVATDFDFNKEVLNDSCLYYEPMNAQDAAKQLARLIRNTNLQQECRKKMVVLLKKYGDYDAHFNAIKKFLIQTIEK